VPVGVKDIFDTADMPTENGTVLHKGRTPRKEGEIGIHAVRGGAVVGEHRVTFYGSGEEIEVVHRALSRRTFAEGALRSASFVAAAEPGLYSMRDVLA
jgi:4-hydroxy-tetrahydrodipicolinate reductase